MKFPRWLASLFGAAVATGPLTTLHAETLEFEGGLFHLFRIVRSELDTLQLVWRDPVTRSPLQNFDGLRTMLERQGQRIHFATNAGIYARGPTPCGLTICDFQVEVPLNLDEGEGNFFLKPNGVFLVDPTLGAMVVTAAEYPTLTLKPRLATQSGPLLLRSGRFHPAIRQDSPNLRQRSGVGVRRSDGQVIFVMSDREDRTRGRVTFHHLARTFVHLGCDDALYLDGDISQMVTDPKPGDAFTPNTFAGMFYVILPNK